MTTYTTLDGQVMDLTGLGTAERAHLERAMDAFRACTPMGKFSNVLVFGRDNPLVAATGGWVTRQVAEHPLFRALHDLADRLGLLQGELAPEPNVDPATDPFRDEWLPVAEAARRKGVTVPGLHHAIGRGVVLARPAKPGGKWLVVSARSLECWTPSGRGRRAGDRREQAVGRR